MRINNVSESYSLPAALLNERGVFTVDHLWACIGNNVDTGVKQVVEKTIAPGLAEAELAGAQLRNQAALLTLLVADALGESTLRFKPKWLWRRVHGIWRNRGRLWPDLMLFVLFLVIIGLGFWALRRNQRVVQRVAVKPGATLPKFTEIDTGQLTNRTVLNQAGTFASIYDLKRRYAAADLTAGTLIKEQQLLPAGIAPELAGRRLLTLAVKNNVTKSAQPIERVKLMLASREKEIAGIVIEDVILVAATKTGETITVVVAVTDAAARSMAPVLGVSDVFVLQSL